MKRKYRSSDSYLPSTLTNSSPYVRRTKRRKTRRVSIDYGRRSSTSSGGLTNYTSSSGSSVGRAVASASGAALGFIHMNVPGAVASYKKAGEFYDYMNSKTVSQTKSSSNNMYSGKFRKPKPFKQSAMMKAQTDGYLSTQEQYGTVTDPNGVYIFQSTFNSAQMALAITTALVRKLFKKAGITVSDRDGSLAFFGVYNADGFKLEMVEYNPITGANSPAITYTTVAADTITTVVANSTFVTTFTNYLNKATEHPPVSMTLYSSDRNGLDSNWRLCSNLDLNAEYLTVVANSTMVLQNQTKAVISASNDIDRNDVQPLNVTMYKFKNDPKLKAIGNRPSGSSKTELIQWQGVGYSGTRLLRAQDFVNTSFQNPPPPGIFSNLTGKSHSTLQPGQMKKNFLTHTFKGKLSNILPKMRMEQFGLSPIKIHGVYCNTNLFCFQERMRTSTTNPIIVAYEHELDIGVFCATYHPKIAMQASLDSMDVSL
ncbi:coat protein [Lake Sarah-associated circular virus-39]|uniref:Coat protein n=1 Tax=Lake Sarah-associated circular virus-39 TaxID=1685767 RepID=A0A126GA67_9VIRU|nr:coat protein [Lake Sarah-associated circular virus-39]ALE29764.1 coat protein [Lake Sarah-associated circular virus-39]